MAPVAQIVDADDVEMDLEEDDAAVDQKVINEEYKTWKKNSPFLYDLLFGTALAWPTLTTQWFPDVKEPEGANYREHRLLIGTHTDGSVPNFVQIAHVQVPKESSLDTADYDDERGEAGGYGGKSRSNDAAVKFQVVQRIEHGGDVNKARFQPQNPDLIATLGDDGRILIFDRTKHPLNPDTPGKIDYQLELVGHKKEGYGLGWNPHVQGGLASGSDDQTVLLWDLNTVQAGSKTLKPSRKYTHHNLGVTDVQYHPTIKPFIGTVSDDMTMQIIDVRQPSTTKSALVARNGHLDAINSLAFNPKEDVIVATASADNTIGIWDLRHIKDKVHTLEGHCDAVTALSWHPQEPGILASASYDRRVLFWDLSRVGEEQTPDDQDDGPPELLFMHGGHTNHLTDFCWNPNDPWLVCSAAEDNVMQVWKVADAIIGIDEASRIRMDELER
jgi:histone-binding protein RBBP4